MEFVNEDELEINQLEGNIEEEEEKNLIYGKYLGPGWPSLEHLENSTQSFVLQTKKKQNEVDIEQLELGKYGIDPKLWTLKKLTLLDLSQPDGSEDDNNKLKHLGPIDLDTSAGQGFGLGLTSLNALRDLILSNNRIGPSIEPNGCFFGLDNLRTLNLENNDITSLPPSLLSLTSLVTINVNNNKLTILPGNLGLLPSLQTIKANGNMITCNSLVTSSSGLTDSPRLSGLHVASNNLEGILPEFIGSIKSLTELDVSQNALDELPESLASAQLKIKKLSISNNSFQDKKLKKLATGDKVQVKAVLQLLRKGKSKRQAKVEQLENELASREPPQREYINDTIEAKNDRKKIMIHREVLSVRPVICAALLHVVEVDSEGCDLKKIRAQDSTNVLFFGDSSNPPGPSFETEIALLDQQDMFNPRLTDAVNGVSGTDSFGMEVSQAASSAMEKFKQFISTQTRIHHNPELGNKRRHGAMGSHNGAGLHWPLQFTAANHGDERFNFSPLRDGWMEGKGRSSPKKYAEKALKIPDLTKHAQTLLALPQCPILYMNADSNVKTSDLNNEDITVLSIAPLTNGWETRTTPVAKGSILLECSSAEETQESYCRKMLLELIKETISMVEGTPCEQNSGVNGKRRIVLVEPVDIVRSWNKQLQTTFPNYEEFKHLPELKKQESRA